MRDLRRFVPFLLLATLLAGPTHAVAIRVLPSSGKVVGPLGQTVQVAVEVDGLGDGAAPSLSAFDITLAYDPAILFLDSTVFGDPVGGSQLDQGAGSFPQITPDSGSVNVLEASFDAPAVLDGQQPGTFTLATLTFVAFEYGTSQLELTRVVLSDSLGDSLAVTAEDGSLLVTAVSEPATATLLGLALAGTAALRRRARRAA